MGHNAHVSSHEVEVEFNFEPGPRKRSGFSYGRFGDESPCKRVARRMSRRQKVHEIVAGASKKSAHARAGTSLSRLRAWRS